MSANGPVTHGISPPPSPSPSTSTRMTLWIWASGLYPRRVAYYLSAKRLPVSVLETHNIHLIPIIADPVKHILISKPGYEERPSGCSFPCLRIERPGHSPHFIYESSAILEYFEDLFPSSQGYEELVGKTAEQRARTRDIMSLLTEAIVWTNVLTRHIDPSSMSWSGMKSLCEQAPSAAMDANRVLHDKMLSKLEKWVKEDVVDRKCQSLSGEGIHVTLADIGVMAMVQYVEDKVGRDWFDGRHEVLREWVERAKKADWFLGKEEIARTESEEVGLRRLFVQ
ncbi:hypothetical protein BCR34DRAFT_597083 [Clohesyomyces aquaticus]|uniref:GST N-terminal domain-containing protein n=1 Tax=Clohesyomyces aquaticus TaxID=1231657 RepID=A0A1Y2A440_9PLEO|nr:hypothetical protein BCR34DRAFT_597083 [Clohesyomyces aquaticus]